ncbi:BspA family leucine-rich repeat surface protein [Lactobacillus gallinarum]|uniref:BspA family leucine-rich repeat surface protein n=1 Tax=Lactobacillus gallinarum TaxID=52242 RepID=UPI0024BAED48|nr:BspA family leucine-rich repeat surface protein [Lactobacillus gallinarum]
MNIHDLQLHFSIRKLSVGVVSCLIGICFISSNQTVQADSMSIASNNKSVIISNSSSNSNPTETKSSNKQDIVDSNNTIPTQIDSHSNQNSTKSNPTETIASKSNNKQNIVDSNNISPTQINSHSNQNSTKTTLVNFKLNVSSQQPAAADSAENKLETAALNPTIDEKLDAKMLAESKTTAQAKDTNGGFDKATWGTLNVNNWKGGVQGDYYQLTDYTGDANHVIVPNEADFAKAGISTSGKQVGVTSALMHTIFKKANTNDATVAFSKTNNETVKAIGSDWSDTWGHSQSGDLKAKLSKFDGTNLDVSNVTNMSGMFTNNHISDLSPLANWNVGHVKDMIYMFASNQISDLKPLTYWNDSNVTDMRYMFYNNQISDLSPLAKWNVGNVKNMSHMFSSNQISDLSPLANWNDSNVTNMDGMFEHNQISDLGPLANWKVDSVTSMIGMFRNNYISDLRPLANWKVSNVTDMSVMFEYNQISDLGPLAKWNVYNVTNMIGMFTNNHISDLSPLANWNVGHVKDMIYMFASNQISDLKPLTYWNDSNVTDMRYMFYNNHISDLSPLAKWNVSNVTNMIGMFKNNRISNVSPLANWDVNNAHFMSGMFDNNSSIIQTEETPTERVINFVYPAGYTGKKQYSVTQTVYVQRELRVELTTKNPRPSTFNSILEWVTKTETPETPDPVYFQDYTVPKIKGLLEPDKTVISKQQADVNKPINVTVTYKLVDSNTNDVFALDSKHGLHEHANVNDNGGYDADYWGKINVDDWDYTVNNDRIEINGLKDGVSTGANDAVIVPNLDDFKLAGKDGGAKAVYISKNTLSKTAWHEYYGLSKTNGSKFVTDSDLNNAFNNSNLTHADLNSLNTSNVTDMSSMFNGARSLTDLDVSNWKTGNVTNMSNMFNGASSLASLDVSNWDTGNVTDMSSMFNGASSLTDLDVSNWKTGNVTNMSNMFNGARSLASLDVSNWDTGNVTNMSWMFNGARSLALIANSGKFADYLVKNNFAYSGINSDVKSVTTDNTKLLKLLTNDIGKSESATRTIVFTFPANYSPDLAKYHLTKVNNIYQIKQSADYDNSYVQGTVLINATGNIAEHRIDTTKPYKLSDTWQPNYDKLVLAHKNADGTVSFDNVQLPKVPGYKAKVIRNNGLLLVNYLVFAPEKLEANNNLSELQFSNKLATNSAVQFNSAIKSNIVVKSDMYQVVNDDHNWQLPVIKSYDLKFVTNKNQIIFAYTKDKQYNYRFVLTFKDGQYRLATFDKQNKLLKTYSIKSYKKLAKIIHSLVLINIA